MGTFMGHGQRAHLLGHSLWVAQRVDGKWAAWIEGENPEEHEALFSNGEEARKAIHPLAHRHLEGKVSCDCADVLRWQHFVGSLGEHRRAKRMDYQCEIRGCEIRDENQEVLQTGRIGILRREGAFVLTPNPPSWGSVLNLSFNAGPAQIQTQGKVVYRNPQQGIGVRFLDLDPGIRETIADILIRRND